jgi:hypothetical protein
LCIFIGTWKKISLYSNFFIESTIKMSESESTKWFRENYPTEHFLFNEIAKHVDKIFSRVTPAFDLIPLDVYQLKTDDGHSRLGVRDAAIMFYGALAKVLVDVIFNEFGKDFFKNKSVFYQKQKIDTLSLVFQYDIYDPKKD